ncbi:MAG TPA: ATP-dependent 6-phosphofructokinase [Polyangiales bacterium]
MKIMKTTQLGEPRHRSPYGFSVADDLVVPAELEWPGGRPPEQLMLFEKAGPRARLFFAPDSTRAAIVTCGGLCPGLNNVIRSVTRELFRGYGVRSLLGIRGGYRGLDPSRGRPPIELTEESVEDIHKEGGTLLGTSRGPVDIGIAVDFLIQNKVDILFTVGGDGTQRGGNALFEEAKRRGHALAVVGIPKTIDNDVRFVTRSFGFGTAVDEAVRVIDAAHTEARSVDNGVALVKLMGRHAGFIAAAATVASQDVNFCLVPEAQVSLAGADGLLAALERRLAHKGHAVIVVAEGAAQELLGPEGEKDPSGNAKLRDIGLFLRDRITQHFSEQQRELTLRYFDPSYQIRARPANSEDAVLCDRLGRYAVHAAMAGKTGLVVSFLHGHFAHVPIGIIAQGSKRLDLEGELYRAVQAATSGGRAHAGGAPREPASLR